LQPVASDKAATERKPAAENQSVDPTDLELTTKVRAAIQAVSGVSATARDVKVISDENSVTLRGQVESAAEKTKLEEAARKAAGSAPVVSELKVAK
jgi:osmotically-inducible protein OsmY